MSSKIVKVEKEVPRKTFIQGNFIGKYFGSLNKEQDAFSISKIYDISIYEGKIFNVVNEVQNFETINESIYENIQSHLQIEQSSFEEVSCFPKNIPMGVDGFKLSIHSPKLENVRIKDVVKEGNQTFGTIYCNVSGYLLDLIIEEEEIEIETCDDCNRPILDCTCTKALEMIPRRTPERSPAIKRLKDYSTDSSWGCWPLIGIFVALFVVFSFGLPGIVFLAVIGLLYLLGRSTIVSQIFTWLAYIVLALFSLAVFLSVMDTCSNSAPRSNNNTIVPKIEKPIPEREPVVAQPKPEQKVQKPQPVYKKSEPVPVASEPVITVPSVYICNGSYAKKYHLTPYCRGLSNCKASVSSISTDDARSMGRTLCGYED